jgi:hypothetical protein
METSVEVVPTYPTLDLLKQVLLSSTPNHDNNRVNVFHYDDNFCPGNPIKKNLNLKRRRVFAYVCIKSTEGDQKNVVFYGGSVYNPFESTSINTPPYNKKGETETAKRRLFLNPVFFSTKSTKRQDIQKEIVKYMFVYGVKGDKRIK